MKPHTSCASHPENIYRVCVEKNHLTFHYDCPDDLIIESVRQMKHHKTHSWFQRQKLKWMTNALKDQHTIQLPYEDITYECKHGQLQLTDHRTKSPQTYQFNITHGECQHLEEEHEQL